MTSPAPDRLAVIVPTRGRPDNIRKVLAAWDFTNAWDCADLHLAVDQDDPELPGYRGVERELRRRGLYLAIQDAWTPMVPKLDAAARFLAGERDEDDYRYSAIAFAGDDHLPRTIGWARRYLDVLGELGTGMAYGDDGYQGAKLSTEWAVTADAVRALGRMVPAPVQHLYCDNAMMDLYGGAGALRHLPEVRIEHMHPAAGKSASDDQYDRVNSRQQYAGDRKAYESWKGSVLHATQIDTIRALRASRLDVAAPQPARPVRQQRRQAVKIGSGPRKIERSGPSRFSAPPKSAFPFPRAFRAVIGATPDEIAFTLADFAKAVPADQEIVELGVYQGRTALIMAWGAEQGNGAHVTAVDAWDLEGNTYHPPFTDPATREQAYRNVEGLGYRGQVRLMQDFAHKVGELDWPGMPKVGLLFVDDDHSYEGAKAAIEAWAPHLALGAVIAVDDYGHPDWPGVAQAVDELVDNGLLAPIEIYHDRLAVTKLAKDWDEEPIEVRMPVTAITSEGIEPAPVTETPAPARALEDMTVGELRKLARERRVPKAATLKAHELIAALKA